MTSIKHYSEISTVWLISHICLQSRGMDSLRGLFNPGTDGVGEESVWPVVHLASYLLVFQVVASSYNARFGSQVKALHTCQAVCVLVQHGEASSMPNCLRAGHSSVTSISSTLEVLWCRLKVKRAALRWTIWSWRCFSWCEGVPNTGGILKNRPDHCLVMLFPWPSVNLSSGFASGIQAHRCDCPIRGFFGW